jgi:hypothetical protein
LRKIHGLNLMRQSAARAAAAVLAAALLAPVFGAGAVLADDLRDLASGDTGLADNPDTPGPDLYAPRSWGDDIPDMPSLLILDAPAEAMSVDAPRPVEPALIAHRYLAPCLPTTGDVAARGPPGLLP